MARSIRDLKRHGRPATVVACISDPVDFAVLNAFHNLGQNPLDTTATI